MKKFWILVSVLFVGIAITAIFGQDVYNNRYTRYIKTLLLMQGTAQIDFNTAGSGETINSSTANQLDIDASTEIELGTITVDLNGGLDVSDSLTVGASGTPVWKIIKDTDLLIITGADTFVIDSVRAK